MNKKHKMEDAENDQTSDKRAKTDTKDAKLSSRQTSSVQTNVAIPSMTSADMSKMEDDNNNLFPSPARLTDWFRGALETNVFPWMTCVPRPSQIPQTRWSIGRLFHIPEPGPMFGQHMEMTLLHLQRELVDRAKVRLLDQLKEEAEKQFWSTDVPPMPMTNEQFLTCLLGYQQSFAGLGPSEVIKWETSGKTVLGPWQRHANYQRLVVPCGASRHTHDLVDESTIVMEADRHKPRDPLVDRTVRRTEYHILCSDWPWIEVGDFDEACIRQLNLRTLLAETGIWHEELGPKLLRCVLESGGLRHDRWNLTIVETLSSFQAPRLPLGIIRLIMGYFEATPISWIRLYESQQLHESILNQLNSATTTTNRDKILDLLGKRRVPDGGWTCADLDVETTPDLVYGFAQLNLILPFGVLVVRHLNFSMGTVIGVVASGDKKQTELPAIVQTCDGPPTVCIASNTQGGRPSAHFQCTLSNRCTIRDSKRVDIYPHAHYQGYKGQQGMKWTCMLVPLIWCRQAHPRELHGPIDLHGAFHPEITKAPPHLLQYATAAVYAEFYKNKLWPAGPTHWFQSKGGSCLDQNDDINTIMFPGYSRRVNDSMVLGWVDGGRWAMYGINRFATLDEVVGFTRT